MRIPAPTALRAVFTGSKPQAGQLVDSLRFAISQSSFSSLSNRLQNNDPTKTEDRRWGVIAPSRLENKAQEVEELTENANGPHAPGKPKDLSGYGSAAKRAGRHIRKAKELPPPEIPSWFLEENVTLREDIPEDISVCAVEYGVSDSSRSSQSIVSSDETEQKDKPGLETDTANEAKVNGSELEQITAKTLDVGNVEKRLAESKQSNTKEGNVQELKKEVPEIITKEDIFNFFYQISTKDGTYGIDASIMHEIYSMIHTGLLSPSTDQDDKWTSSKNDLVLYHPKNGGSYFLDALVQNLASINAADLVRLDPLDIAEIGGSYLEEGRDTHVKSLCSLGYDAYQAVSLRASQASDENSEEEADDIEEEDDDDDGSRSRSNPFRSSNISVIPMARLGGNIMDILGSTLTNVYPSNSPKPSTNVRVLGRTVDITDDLKTSTFIETILNACDRKRGLENDNGSTSNFAPRESSTEAFAEELKGTTDSVDEADPKDLNLDSNSAIDDVPIVAATKNSKSTRGSLIVMIRDYMEINMTPSGAKILKTLHDIVRGRRKEGQRIMVVGTSTSKELIPSLSKSGFKSIQAESENGPIRTIIAPCRTQSSGCLDRDHKLRISTINFRNLEDMLRKISPGLGQIELVQSPLSPLQEEICKTIWPLDYVHHLATFVIGITIGDDEELGVTQVNQALMILSESEKAKYDWIEREKVEEKRKVKSIKKPIDSSGEDSLRFMSVAEGEERMKKLRRTCNPHEKKLLNGVVDPDSIRTTFSDVHAPPETIEALKTLTSLSLIRPDAFTYGVLATDRIPGLLLYGPPGTGKTLLAKAVAKESGATVLEVSGSDVYNMYVGEGEKNVRAIFTLAKKLTPCVVFIDEADALLGSRGGSSNRTTHRELINQFLREWDGMNELSAFIMVATNRPFDLDEASLRRLPRRLLVDLPTEKDREAILKIHLKDELLDPAVSLGDLASQTPFYSGSDLKNLSVAAALSCVREEFDLAAASKSNDPNSYRYPDKRTLHPRHFTYAMGEISASVSEDMGSLSAIRKFDEKFGDRKGRRKKLGGYGFETVKEGERNLSDAARVRNKT